MVAVSMVAVESRARLKLGVALRNWRGFGLFYARKRRNVAEP
jgi:hypothetical protein